MYIHSFRLITPRKLLEAQSFNQQYQKFVRLIKLDLGTLRCWENDEKQMFKIS